MGRRLVCAVALAVLAGCGDDDGTGPDNDIPPELIATWFAGPACAQQGCAFTLFSRADPNRRTDYVTLGVTVEMFVQSSGRLRMQVGLGGQQDLLDGTLRVQNGRLLVRAGGAAEDTLDYALAGNFLNVELRSRLDWNLGAGEEPVGLTATFRKQ